MTSESLWRNAAFYGSLLLLLVYESIAARRPLPDRANRRWLHFLLGCTNGAMVTLLFMSPLVALHGVVTRAGWGLFPWLGLVEWQQFLVLLFVVDLGDYAYHRAMHRWGPLWRFHRVHHSDEALDLSTTWRGHIGESTGFMALRFVEIALLAPTWPAFSAFFVVFYACNHFHHADIKLPAGLETVLGRVLVTPRSHLVHHVADRRYQWGNYGVIFSFWDRFFATHSAREFPAGTPIGLPGETEEPFSMTTLFLSPFRGR